jgi:glycosyltransferase involved in cell wall biosynthesis
MREKPIAKVILEGTRSAVFSKTEDASNKCETVSQTNTQSPRPSPVSKWFKEFQKMFHLVERRLKKFRKSYEKRRKQLTKNLSAAGGLLQRRELIVRRGSVLFIGYAEAALGLGEVFRNMLTALDAAGMPFAIYPFNKDVETRHVGPFLESRYDRHGVYDINVALMATDQLPYYFSELQKQVKGGRHNILQTYWELEEAPLAWRPLLEGIDELWVPNSYVAKAFLPIFDRKITVVPACINVNSKHRYARNYFDMDDDRFYFIASFDYYSKTARKNPLGVAIAFGYAFTDPETKVGLLIKSAGPGELDPTVSQQLKNLSAIDKRIITLSRSVGRDEMLSLIDDCDCYISLHRAEGFGLGMAEALALGKPVIATDYSGNRDFLTESTGFPVPFSLRKLMPGEYPTGEGQSWAEPDLEVAIRHMRTVFADRGEREGRCARGKQYIEDHYSGRVVAKVVMDRLDEIRKSL